MAKIDFIIDGFEYILFIEEKHLQKVAGLSGELEKGGYIFASKIKGTNEYVVELLTDPHKDDICTETFIELSRKHSKIAKSIKRKDRALYEIGFYHTHPSESGCKPSTYDMSYFKEVSSPYDLSVFMIGVKERVNILIYSRGKQIVKETIWKQHIKY